MRLLAKSITGVSNEDSRFSLCIKAIKPLANMLTSVAESVTLSSQEQPSQTKSSILALCLVLTRFIAFIGARQMAIA